MRDRLGVADERGPARGPTPRHRNRREDGLCHALVQVAGDGARLPRDIPVRTARETPRRIARHHLRSLVQGTPQRRRRLGGSAMQMEDDLVRSDDRRQMDGALQHEVWSESADRPVLSAGRFTLAAVHDQHRAPGCVQRRLHLAPERKRSSPATLQAAQSKRVQRFGAAREPAAHPTGTGRTGVVLGLLTRWDRRRSARRHRRWPRSRWPTPCRALSPRSASIVVVTMPPAASPGGPATVTPATPRRAPRSPGTSTRGHGCRSRP